MNQQNNFHFGSHIAPVQNENNYHLFGAPQPQQSTNKPSSRNAQRSAQPAHLYSQQHYKHSHAQPQTSKQQYHPYSNQQRTVLQEITNKHNQQLIGSQTQPFKGKEHFSMYSHGGSITQQKGSTFVIKNNQVVSTSQARPFLANQQQPFGPLRTSSLPTTLNPLTKPMPTTIPDLPKSSSIMEEDDTEDSIELVEEDDYCVDEDEEQDEDSSTGTMEALDDLGHHSLFVVNDVAQYCDEYALDIYRHMRHTEDRYKANPDYIKLIQADINPSMRGILVDWLNEVCQEYKLKAETLYLAINIVDRTLSKFQVNRNKLQEVGITGLFIAAKYHELQAPTVDEFVFITDSTYPREELLEMESLILNALEFNLTVVTSVDFLVRFCNASPQCDERLLNLAFFVSELSLQDYKMIGFPPSAVAASSVVIALHALGRTSWCNSMRTQTGYNGPELMECIQGLMRLYCESETSALTAVKSKYARSKHLEVSKVLAPRTMPNMDVV